MTIFDGLKIRWEKSRAGSSPATRTNCLSVKLPTDGGKERSTSSAQGKVVAVSMRATPLHYGGVGRASDQEYVSRFLRSRISFYASIGRGLSAIESILLQKSFGSFAMTAVSAFTDHWPGIF